MIVKGKIGLINQEDNVMKENKMGFVIIALLLLFLITISVLSIETEESVLEEAINTAENTFRETSPESNSEVENFTLYIPDELDVDERNNNNAVLVSGDGQSYILFINDKENKNSTLNYETVRETGENEWLQSFEDAERFGYIYINPLDGEYEVQLGVGGVKLTTISGKDSIVDDVAMMMAISNSVEYEEIQEG